MAKPCDLVLDCYCGSGTILEAAEKLGRKFIGVDISDAAINATVKRFREGRSTMGDFVGVRGRNSAPRTSKWLFPAQELYPGDFSSARALSIIPCHNNLWDGNPMGNFYVNFTTHGSDTKQIAGCLRSLDRQAYVSPTIDGVTVFYDREADSQREVPIMFVGSGVSRRCNCPVLAVINHDDDILYYYLFEGGVSISNYDSFPGYWDDGDRAPTGGDAETLCGAFGRADEDTIDEVDSVLTEEDYVFALDRHKELVEWLGIPWRYACMCYGHIERGYLAEGVSLDELEKVGGDSR